MRSNARCVDCHSGTQICRQTFVETDQNIMFGIASNNGRFYSSPSFLGDRIQGKRSCEQKITQKKRHLIAPIMS